jgi:uncharacterized protein
MADGFPLGEVTKLSVRRMGPPGAFLGAADGDDALLILLPRAEVPPGAKVGDELQVFVYKDSEDRPIATTRTPRIMLGEVAFLEIVDVARVGAFADWGLMKELLVPYAEQTRPLQRGDRCAIGLYLDVTNRLAGTMRVAELLRERPDVERGAWVDGEAWRFDPEIGLFVIFERRYVGLVPRDEPHTLRRGDASRFRVANVLADGKVELSARAVASEQRDEDAARILAALSRPRPPKLGDRSPPETIRDVLGLSKKAFKRAVGGLLKRREVTIDADGWLVVAQAAAPKP